MFRDPPDRSRLRSVAWLSVGAPILGLVLVIIVLSVASLYRFALNQDRAAIDASTRLVESALGARKRAIARIGLDYAVWTDAYDATTASWDQAWLEDNFYTNVADGFLVIGAAGEARYTWLADEYAADSDQVAALISTMVRANTEWPSLALQTDPGLMSASEVAVYDGALVLLSVTPITPEENGAPLPRDASKPTNLFVALDFISAAELASIAEGLQVRGLGFVDTVDAIDHDEHVSLSIAGSNASTNGYLIWTRERPGTTALAGEVGASLLVLLLLGACAFFIAARLVSAYTKSSASIAAAQAAVRAKSDFIATMTHELRTPMNAIVGYAEMIQEQGAELGPAGRQVTADAASVLLAARHLNRLINDVLDHSRASAGTLRVECEPVCVSGSINEIEAPMRALAEASGNALSITISPNVSTVFADPLRLSQCLTNLVSNALKFTKRGEVSLTAQRQSTPRGDMVAFEVKDNGIGIAEDDLPRLFMPFAQANPAISECYGGTGLGLSITRSLARARGGDVTVTSVLGVGSCFTLRLPTGAEGQSDRLVA